MNPEFFVRFQTSKTGGAKCKGLFAKVPPQVWRGAVRRAPLSSLRCLAFCLIVLGAGPVRGQQTGPSAPLPSTDAHSPQVTVYPLGPGVIAPKLVSSGLLPSGAEKCKKPLDGTVLLWMVVGTSGTPSDISVLQPLNNDLDKLAVLVAERDFFRAGSHDGESVAVRISLEVGMQGCFEKARDETGKKIHALQLRSEPVQKIGALLQPPGEFRPASGTNPTLGGHPVDRVGGEVRAPVPVLQPEAHYTTAARRKHIEGRCIVSLIVDALGMPQNPRVVRSLDPGLDQNALDAVMKYRFKPAMKGSVPVPVMIWIEVTFRLR
jgi:TonB family protein